MNGFAKRAELIREKIKKTVLEMLKTWEPRKIRIADIAAEARVSQVTIYNYFGSKESLLREAFKDYMEKSFADFEAFIATGPTMKEIVQYSLFYDKEAIHAYSPDFFREFLVDDREMYEYMERIYRDRAMPLVVRFIEEGKKRGEISSKLSTPTLVMYFNMFKDQSKTILDMAQQSGDPEAFVEEIIRLFYYGVCGEDR
ncbi:TetR family transcriptional regulator [Cohnella xylanilytica]|uniref:TetR/AcrR family transcriptional regulator n=1 Tax=Cohnella xylanilytica TaxID=557555 RepID=A0A841TQ73_9BACL|nr:TetR/AcrR family transcriptional regulator [Cohnella xylanilytica]MBB6690477.1 TetR/AcrR family transcriptional regulator [Cohnella xylanilytica]GIO12371.1 TetR family transcriptional regulator [Cohnella xylanilytica]